MDKLVSNIALSSLDNTDEEEVDELTLPNFKIY